MAYLKSVLIPRPAPVLAAPPEILAERYNACRCQTDSLAAALTAEDQMVQSCADASPTKWHLAHTAWFFETFILSPHLPGYRPLNSKFRDLFNSYYNAVGRQPEKSLRNTFSRPSLDEVQKYRRHVDEHMAKLLESDAASAIVLQLTELGINHEQQHQELLVTDIKHAFWTNPLRPAYQQETINWRTSPASERHVQGHAEGLREIGAAPGSFHFDNEAPRHRVYIPRFRIASRPATCGEYLAFMDDHGYQRPELWLSDGWKVVQAHGWTAPLYWEKDEDGWQQFTCAGMQKLSEGEPVCHISYYEADAFARWASARLPTEFEWEVAAEIMPVEGNFLEADRFHPEPAPTLNGDQPAMLQIFGDVWEWTASAYLPYPGYRPAAGALGEYNAKFMSNQMVLRGGSCVTARSHIRTSYRNFFPPETRWQFSGVRLADDGI